MVRKLRQAIKMITIAATAVAAKKSEQPQPMSLFRITEYQHGQDTVIQVDGQLMSDGARELERVCREATPPLILELTNLRTANSDGLRMLKRLSSEGVRLTGASRYIELLLEYS
jgi:hypothetical protein